VCYDRGFGVKADHDRARKYFEEAVKLGNSSALYELAMLQMGQGKKQEALVNFQRAAGGSADANFALGQMYYFGTNVAQDRARGLRCIRTAAGGNHVEALFFLAGLTFNGEPDAPALDEAIRFAQLAENFGHPQAARVREKLEQRRKDRNAAPEEATRARSS
jgi:TPR repeat protein